mmetsp:Transcript_32907/g.68584  ORF Transcript_32907/g.68584 Transcript_32907/m.68584 type:complete len:235 (-) Transcript_32907:388-1092(-)
MIARMKCIDNIADFLHWTEKHNLVTHNLSCREIMMPRHGLEFRFHKVHALFEMNVNMIQIMVEQLSHNTCRHEGQHQGQDKLFISRTLQQNDGQTDGHAGHASQNRRGTNQGVDIGKCQVGIDTQGHVSDQSSKGRPTQQTGNKETRRNRDTIDHHGQGNVRNKEKDQCQITKGVFVQMEQLSNGHTWFGKPQGGQFIVGSGRTRELDQFFQQILFRFTNIILRERRTLGPHPR